MAKIKKNFVVAADAGHGLGTPGKRCMKTLDPNETREWIMNDRVARAFQERAAAYEGLVVVRVDDCTGRTNVPLQQRVELANAIGADLYWSAHHNAGLNGQDRPGRHDGGIVAYCSRGSTRSPEWRDAIYDASIAAGGIKGDRTEPKARADWYVCKHTNMPAVLMEYGFMDSPEDVPIILDPEYSRRMGYAAADAVAKKAGLKLREQQEPAATPTIYRQLGEIPAGDLQNAAAALMACGALQGWGDERGLDLGVEDLRHIAMMRRYVDWAVANAMAEPVPEIADEE